jgi:DNA-binding NtrC family response regulator
MSSGILLLGAQSRTADSIRRMLATEGLSVLSAETMDQALAVLDQADAAVFCDHLEGGYGLLECLRAHGKRLPVVVVSSNGTPDNVVMAARFGAVDVLCNPLDTKEFLAAVRQALARAGAADARRDSHELQTVVGTSGEMHAVFKLLGVAASNDLNVLITGETGVGKEVAAHIVHRHSARADGPFVAINCTAIPETLLEAELFGYGRGAFTGATRDTRGKIEAANGGTLFLDEIGDMPLAFQSKLLRFLDDKGFYRLGESTARRSNTRIIAATNRPLPNSVADGTFRSDLYYRLAQLPVAIPPLRERPDDIRQLINTFIRELNRDLGLAIEGVTERAISQALAYRWPGNIRELKNVVLRAAMHTRAGRIEHLELAETPKVNGNGAGHGEITEWIDEAVSRGDAHHLIERFEADVLRSLLKAYHGNRTRVAEDLGISRNTLRAKLRAHGLGDLDSH